MRRVLKPSLLLAGLTMALTACTTVMPLSLPLSTMDQCAAEPGVSLRFNALTIALGERPHTGYGIDLVGQQQDDGDYQLIFRERYPAPDRQYAQVMTSPCLQVILPAGWQHLTVTDQLSGQEWTFTPQDPMNKQPSRTLQAPVIVP
ncbi:MAG: protease complex subunit PrcB family protein [Saccharospirillaceae bacterium]|nr:protease complex subunit PrcB family protein [Saccharospirillaceae bacterium]MCD8531417.1 protease complex subunit PrcB family protein [Saccharospirillaceae bacterium]